jgi:hypothetical protein
MSPIELIYAYTTMTKAAAAQLQRELGVAELLQAWQRRQVPQRGSLSDGSTYQFHGIGCVIERPDDHVAPTGRVVACFRLFTRECCSAGAGQRAGLRPGVAVTAAWPSRVPRGGSDW